MSGTVAAPGKLQQSCTCRNTIYAHQKKRTNDWRRKRQSFVYNPEEEIWHEPYMQSLRREFSDESVQCDSKIELPWKSIALPTKGMRIRSDVTSSMAVEADREMDGEGEETVGEKRESVDVMVLPWQNLLITETPRGALDYPGTCDSSVEIPWADLTLQMPIDIRSPREEIICAPDDVEIPWDEILVPRNIVIRSEQKQKHPSSDQPPRPRVDATCIPCGASSCCAKVIRARTTTQVKTDVANIAGSNCLLTCM